MKKRLLTLFCLVATVILAACGVKKVDAGESIKTTFTGLDTKGELVYQVNTQELVKEFLLANPKADAKTEEEVRVAATKVKVTPSKTEGLSNDDEITFTFASDKDAEKYFNLPKETKVKVSGLKEAKKLTAEELAKITSLEVEGFNKGGRAEVHVTDSKLSFLRFKVENNGKLENGKDAKIVLDGNFANLLEDRGYVLEGDGSFTLPVKGLKTVAEKLDDAKNKDEIIAKLKEEVNKKFSGNDKITFDKTYYRGLANNVDNSYSYGDEIVRGNGNLVMTLQVETSFGFKNVYAVGFTNLIMNEEGKMELKDARVISTIYADFSTATQKLEAIGYTEVK